MKTGHLVLVVVVVVVLIVVVMMMMIMRMRMKIVSGIVGVGTFVFYLVTDDEKTKFDTGELCILFGSQQL
jgi:hypothetical protein